MIIKESVLNIVDNSGGLKARTINLLGRPFASIGDIIVVSIIKALPNRKEIERGKVSRALIIRTKKGIIRPDGTIIQFDENAVILIDTDLTPKGSRIFGPLPLEISKFSKIASLATKFI